MHLRWEIGAALEDRAQRVVHNFIKRHTRVFFLSSYSKTGTLSFPLVTTAATRVSLEPSAGRKHAVRALDTRRL